MDYVLLFHVTLSLSILGSTSSAQADIHITTSGSNASFTLPKSSDVIVGFSSGELGIKSYGFEFSVGGDAIHRHKRFSADPKPHWRPFLLISEKVIESYYWNDYQIPAPYQTVEGRELAVSSSSAFQWQQISLPVEDEETSQTDPGEAKYLTLPEKDDVWVAIRNSRPDTVNIDYQLIYNKNNGTEIFHGRIQEGWSVIAVANDLVSLGLEYHFLKNTEIKGRQLMLVTEASVDVQVFPMPLGPTMPIPLNGSVTLVRVVLKYEL